MGLFSLQGRKKGLQYLEKPWQGTSEAEVRIFRDPMAIRRIRKFHPGTEIALDRYLLSRLKIVGSIFGITNVAILLACLWYVFFILPQSALEQARVTISGQIRESVQDQVRAITQAAVTSMSKVSEEAGQSNLKLKQLDDELKAAREQTADAQKEVGVLKSKTEMADRDLTTFKAEVEKLKATAGEVTDAEVTQTRDLVKYMAQYKEGRTFVERQKEHSDRLTGLATLTDQQAQQLREISATIVSQRTIVEGHEIRLAVLANLQGQLDSIARGASEQERQKIIEKARQDLVAAQEAARKAAIANQPKPPFSRDGGGGLHGR